MCPSRNISWRRLPFSLPVFGGKNVPRRPTGGRAVALPEAQDPHALIQKALAGDPASVRALVDRLSPVISRRVAATLWRRPGKRNVAQDVADMSQDVFLSLFQSDGKALRAWDPARGMSLEALLVCWRNIRSSRSCAAGGRHPGGKNRLKSSILSKSARPRPRLSRSSRLARISAGCLTACARTCRPGGWNYFSASSSTRSRSKISWPRPGSAGTRFISGKRACTGPFVP